MLQRTVKHRPAPNHGGVAAGEHADRDDLHAMRLWRHDHVFDLGGPALNASRTKIPRPCQIMIRPASFKVFIALMAVPWATLNIAAISATAFAATALLSCALVSTGSAFSTRSVIRLIRC